MRATSMDGTDALVRLQPLARDLEVALARLAVALRRTLAAAARPASLPGEPAAVEALLRALLDNDRDFVCRHLPLPGRPARQALVAYVDGLVDDRALAEAALEPLLDPRSWPPPTARHETQPSRTPLAR
ncbi:MAG: hypothetical protein IRY95_06820, partial [Clostridia bacterium]|nr:hypothetical protein [Clostridia bacterium]